MIELQYSGSGLPIVCLHGWGFDHSIWQCLNSVWPRDWQMISVDLPGHGLTKAMSMKKFTHELLQKLPRKFAVIGWSLGGLYAFQLAKQAGFRLKHLFAVATSPCFMKKENWPGIESIVLSRFYRRYSSEPIKTVQDFIAVQFLNHLSPITYTYSPSLPSDAELGLRLLEFSDLRHYIDMNTKKLSFILGTQDSIVPVNLAGALNKNMGVTDIQTIDHCGHMPFLTHSEIFIEHIKERLA